MGAVKQFYHEQLVERYDDSLADCGPEPGDLEMLQIEAERALERYAEAVKKHEESNVKPL